MTPQNMQVSDTPAIDYDLESDIDDCDDDEDDQTPECSISLTQVQAELNTPSMLRIKTELKTLMWSKKLVLMELADLSDEQAASMFGIESHKVKEIRTAVKSDDSWVPGDFLKYTRLVKRATSNRRESKSVNIDGRPIKGTKIRDAFASVTEIPVLITELSEKFDVSTHVLEQFNRFANEVSQPFLPAGFKIVRVIVNRNRYLRLVPI